MYFCCTAIKIFALEYRILLTFLNPRKIKPIVYFYYSAICLTCRVLCISDTFCSYNIYDGQCIEYYIILYIYILYILYVFEKIFITTVAFTYEIIGHLYNQLNNRVRWTFSFVLLVCMNNEHCTESNIITTHHSFHKDNWIHYLNIIEHWLFVNDNNYIA